VQGAAMLTQYFRLNPRRGWRSRAASRRHILRMVLPALLFATVVTLAWSELFTHDIHLEHHGQAKDTDIIGFAIVVQAAIFAIAAAILLNGTWERIRALSRHVLKRDRAAFMELREEKMPIPMHIVLHGSGLSILMLLIIAPYSDPLHGAIIIFSTSFVVVLYTVVLRALQDVSKNVWIMNRVPKEWLQLNVDEYFGTGFSEH
jgi:hypothetical protein